MASGVMKCSQEVWSTPKRTASGDESDDGKDVDINSHNLIVQLTKRFKDAGTASVPTADDLKPASVPISVVGTINACVVLSPITEITNNLSNALIGSAEAAEEATDGDAQPPSAEGSCDTPKVKLGIRKRIIIFAESSNVEASENGASVIIKSTKSGGVCHLDMDEVSALHDMAGTDVLSLYVDNLDAGSNSSSSNLVPGSPPMMGLLSPEGSPRRFQIVSRKGMGHNRSTTTTANINGRMRSFHSLSSCSMDSSSIDDEYMELIEMESLEQPHALDIAFPAGLNTLISGQIVGSSQQQQHLRTPELRRATVRRCLSLTESHTPTNQLHNLQQQQVPTTPELLRTVQTSQPTTPFSSLSSECTTSVTFKRPEPPCSTVSPVQVKRLRSTQDKENQDDSFTKLQSSKCLTSNVVAPRPVLRKSMSMNDAEIMTALARSENRSEPDLIGDFTKPFALPLMEGRHRDLKSISSDTVASLIKGEFREQINSYKIIDCRYPYEYEGGHIRGALNLYTQEQIVEEFLTQQQQQPQLKTETETETETTTAIEAAATGKNKRNIIIFHCEFSSERGPKLSRFLRNHDRERNTNTYPSLDYPEIYLLHNGYKEFYQTHAELCDPIAYRPMLEPSYSEAYRQFRAKSKSWNGDGCGGATSRHMKKSRSRLML